MPCKLQELSVIDEKISESIFENSLGTGQQGVMHLFNCYQPSSLNGIHSEMGSFISYKANDILRRLPPELIGVVFDKSSSSGRFFCTHNTPNPLLNIITIELTTQRLPEACSTICLTLENFWRQEIGKSVKMERCVCKVSIFLLEFGKSTVYVVGMISRQFFLT